MSPRRDHDTPGAPTPPATPLTADELPPVIRPLAAALEDRYTIEREIGRGGMATVYLARDARHHRPVALKVLNPELGAVLGVERFLAEIEVTANLQHPNLLPLFDSGEAAGLLFYVMPFVPGETLRVRLDREKQLPVEEATRIAAAIASGLDYAHRKGVIHRDLKPENILLSEGQPLIADFGIALAVSNAGGNRITQTGLSLGTPQYMSPEQAMGDRVIDGRTDVYSLGAVLYEMLCGEPPHAAATSQAVIARVLTEAPREVRLNRPSVPESVADAVHRALEKLPADRWQTAGQFGEAIAGGAVNRTATFSRQRSARGRPRNALMIALAALTALAVTTSAIAVAQWRAARRPTSGFAIRVPLITPGISMSSLVQTSPVAVSRDGSLIAISGDKDGKRQLFLRYLNEDTPRPIPGTDGAQGPFFSPDTKWLGFWAGGRLFKVSLGGGAPVPITEIAVAFGAAWVSSDVIVVSRNNALYTVSAGGGPLQLLTRPDTVNGEAAQVFPESVWDGESIIYTSLAPARAGGGTRVGIVSVPTGKATILPINGYRIGVVDDHLIYSDAASGLFAVPVDIKRRRITGASKAIANDILVYALGPNISMSQTGTLVYESVAPSTDMVLVDLQGGSRPALHDTRSFAFPRYSPDGKRVAVSVGASGGSDVWVYELANGTGMRLTTDGLRNERPEWTPDGAAVIYRSTRDNRAALWRNEVDFSARPVAVLTNPRLAFYEGVITADGKWLVFQQDTITSDIGYRAVTGDTTLRLITHTPESNETMARVSPDGRWVAYVSDESGSDQVVVQPFPNGGRTQVSASGGTEPVWSRDGRTLFYRDGRSIMAASFTTAPGFAVTSRRALFDDRYVRATSPHANYDVSRDGKEFLLLRSLTNSAFVVVHNWRAELWARTTAKP